MTRDGAIRLREAVPTNTIQFVWDGQYAAW